MTGPAATSNQSHLAVTEDVPVVEILSTSTVVASTPPTESTSTSPIPAPGLTAQAEEQQHAPSGSRSDASSSGSSTTSSNAPSPLQDTTEPEHAQFVGDRSLAQSIMFMADTMLSRDASHAVANGDIGRLWNDMKMMTFKFAGSSHSKYVTYMLEMTCQLELESSDALRTFFLRNWLVNPSGEAGCTLEGDLHEEHINRELEGFISRKGGERDSKFIREVVAPNIQHFIELKNEWGQGVGLAKCRVYRNEELHKFRCGRAYNTTPTLNTFHEGYVSMEKEKLAKFIQDSTRARIFLLPSNVTMRRMMKGKAPNEPSFTTGDVEMVDGELIVAYGDIGEPTASELAEMGVQDETEDGEMYEDDS
ncbi:hypothetical protein LXA43DRAFT_1069592 [Ganoderma leucocontextum]|nr:hypothetical protein LXA43DRAFT_1069592 [Ganoderma leucocontextum]